MVWLGESPRYCEYHHRLIQSQTRCLRVKSTFFSTLGTIMAIHSMPDRWRVIQCYFSEHGVSFLRERTHSGCMQFHAQSGFVLRRFISFFSQMQAIYVVAVPVFWCLKHRCREHRKPFGSPCSDLLFCFIWFSEG